MKFLHFAYMPFLALVCHCLSAQQIAATTLGIPPHGEALQWYAKQAKEKGYRVVLLPKGIGNPPGSSIDLDTALRNYDVVIADMVQKAVVVNDDYLLTWYKFRIVDTISAPSSVPSFPNAQRPPQSFDPMGSNNFAVVEPGGTTKIAGVVLREEIPFEDTFLPGHRYLLFMNKGVDKVAIIPGHWQGVLAIQNDALIPRGKTPTPLSTDIASRFNNSLKALVSDLKRTK